MLITKSIIILSSLFGLYITLRIGREKKKEKSGQKMVCPVGQDCSKVIFSDYSTFFGISLEKIGLLYYVITLVFYGASIMSPEIVTPLVLFISFGMAFASFTFSLYLTLIQIFRLRSLCTWCLSSAVASTAIFVASIFLIIGNKEAFFDFLAEMATVIKLVEFFSLFVGMAVVTIAEILIFRFLKDFRLNRSEDSIIQIIEQVNWFTLFGFIIGNFGILLIEEKGLPTNLGSYLTLENIVALFIIFNLSVATTKTLPILRKYHYNPHCINVFKAIVVRKIALIHSGINLVSWYFLFYLNFMTADGMGDGTILRGYIYILLVAILIIQTSIILFDKSSRQKQLLKR